MKFRESQVRISNGSMMVIFVSCDSQFRNKQETHVIRVCPVFQDKFVALVIADSGDARQRGPLQRGDHPTVTVVSASHACSIAKFLALVQRPFKKQLVIRKEAI